MLHFPTMAARFVLYFLLYSAVLYVFANLSGGIFGTLETLLVVLVAGFSVYLTRPITIDMEANDPAAFMQDAQQAAQNIGYERLGEANSESAYSKRSMAGMMRDFMMLKREGDQVSISGNRRDLHKLSTEIQRLRANANSLMRD